jgi:hypothetical protein
MRLLNAVVIVEQEKHAPTNKLDGTQAIRFQKNGK